MEEERIPEVREEDIFDNDIIEDTNNFQGIITFAAVLLAAGGFIALSLYAYENYSAADSNIDIPIIVADSQPVKVKPVDPGGMNIPNVDKKVYDNLSEFREKKLPKVERILPKEEEPVDVHHFAEQASKLALEDKIAALETFDNVASMERQEPNGSELSQQIGRNKKVTITAAAKRRAVAKRKRRNKIAARAIVATPKPALGLVKDIPKSGRRKITQSDFKSKNVKSGFRVQIASLKSAKAANKQWSFLNKKHKAVLKSVKHFVVPKDIKGKGKMYRLQLGPFNSESIARKLCNKLSEAGQGCFILRPGK